jgi:putative endonuclease
VIGSVKPLPELEKRKLSSRQLKQAHFALGQRGEFKAKQFLIDKKYKILDTNVVFGKNEVDIVAYDLQAKELVFVEVKTRSKQSLVHASQAVSKKKLIAINNVARQFIKLNHYYSEYRIDAICVTGREVEQFENISWW